MAICLDVDDVLVVLRDCVGEGNGLKTEIRAGEPSLLVGAQGTAATLFSGLPWPVDCASSSEVLGCTRDSTRPLVQSQVPTRSHVERKARRLWLLPNGCRWAH